MSAPMITLNLPQVTNAIHRYLKSWLPGTAIPIPLTNLPTHDIETLPSILPRTLKHLLKANHANFAIFYHSLQFHNHLSHHLASSYLLGATASQLHHIYDETSKELEEWGDAGEEIVIAEDDYREYLGRREMQRAFVDFFEDELALKYGYGWGRVCEEFLWHGNAPIGSWIVGRLGHPLIHLSYAYTLHSREIAMEALAMAACSYNSFMAKYFDNPIYTQVAQLTSLTPIELLTNLQSDLRLPTLTTQTSDHEALMAAHESLILEYWNAWCPAASPLQAFRESQECAMALLVHVPRHDFFLAHILTTSHALRVLIPYVPTRFHINLSRQWWLLTILTYMGQLCPTIANEAERKGRARDAEDNESKSWEDIESSAIDGKWANDPHFVKCVVAMREASRTWKDASYLKASRRFVTDFKGWNGFSDERTNAN